MQIRDASRSSTTPCGGSSFVELLFALAVVGVALVILVQQITISLRETHVGEDKLFAYRKGMAILAELQAGVEQGLLSSASALDQLDDGNDLNPLLTTRLDEPASPDHVMSGNVRLASGAWKWSRKIDVQAMEGDDLMRYTSVRVMRRDAKGRTFTEASIGGVLNIPATASPPVKEYDVYALAIAAAPSLWMPLPSLRALLHATVQDLQARNPGLRFRVHWITKFGYGRDPSYTPYVNEDALATTHAPWVYWYPGNVGSASPLFSAGLFTGRVRDEGGIENDHDPVKNPLPHAVADRFNHCMRMPAARALFEQRVEAGLEDADEPPLQLLFADMFADPQRYKNAIVLNLHGGAMPFPPIRNYSDPAKDPSAHPGVRVVTHPERLHTPRDPDGNGDHGDTADVRLRVYAYKTDPDVGPAVLDEQPITLQIFGADLTAGVNGESSSAATLEIRRIPGGVDPATGSTTTGDRDYDHATDSGGMPPDPGESHEPFEMHYEVGYVAAGVGVAEPYTWIRLHNTPLVTPLYKDEGLPPQFRLYGLEYVPSPVSSSTPFRPDLDTDGDKPKNTARWEIAIPSSVFTNGALTDADTVVRIATRIGKDVTTGRAWPTSHQPHNVSETYAWWTANREAVPLTERYQVLGDPRHSPYADLAAGGASFPHGYNWFFDDLRSGSDDATPHWSCLDAARLRDGFGQGVTEDVPRIVQIWRHALQRSRAVVVNCGGRAAEALVLGGEIARPRSPGELRPTPVALAGGFYGLGSPAIVDTLSATQPDPPAAPVGGGGAVPCFGRPVVVASTGEFWAMPWLGELAPDAQFAGYASDGNLPCGATAAFRRAIRSAVTLPGLPAGTDFAAAAGSWLGDLGPCSFVHHRDLIGLFGQKLVLPPATAEWNAGALDIFAAASVTPTDPMSTPFPLWGRHVPSVPLPQEQHLDVHPRQRATVVERLAAVNLLDLGAATLSLDDPRLDHPCFLVPITDVPADALGHREVAVKSLLLGLRALHRAGEPARNFDVAPLPIVEIVGPRPSETLVRPVDAQLRWTVRWTRFDEKPYTSAYGSGFAGDEANLEYVITYTRAGEPWRHVADDEPATPGVRPDDVAYRVPDTSTGDETFLLPLAAVRFPAGQYTFRVDCHHRHRRQHVAHHEVHVAIRW